MISISVADHADLEQLVASNLDPTRLLAFTGTKEPNEALNQRLYNAGIETIFGTLGGQDSWDAKIARRQNDRLYLDILGKGVTILATDRPQAVAAALTQDEAVVAACTSP